jgi:carboxylesterase type B
MRVLNNDPCPFLQCWYPVTQHLDAIFIRLVMENRPEEVHFDILDRPWREKVMDHIRDPLLKLSRQGVSSSCDRTFKCPADQTARNCYAAGAETFRYYYTGNFSSIAPRPSEGSYHSSELPLIFGTSGIARGPSTTFEISVSEKTQDLYLAFASDPVNGLKSQWPLYKPSGQAIEFGKDAGRAGYQHSQSGGALRGICP